MGQGFKWNGNNYTILSHTKENEVLSKNIVIDPQSKAERGLITL